MPIVTDELTKGFVFLSSCFLFNFRGRFPLLPVRNCKLNQNYGPKKRQEEGTAYLLNSIFVYIVDCLSLSNNSPHFFYDFKIRFPPSLSLTTFFTGELKNYIQWKKGRGTTRAKLHLPTSLPRTSKKVFN